MSFFRSVSVSLSVSLPLSLSHACIYIYITDIPECIICTVHFMLNNIDVSPPGMIQSNTVEYIVQYILCNIARVMCIHICIAQHVMYKYVV